MSLEFLSPLAAAAEAESAPVARSPMERSAAYEGAKFEVRDGWKVAASFGAPPEHEAQNAARTVGWADVSHLGKLELQAPAAQLATIVSACAEGAELELGTATRAAGAWWCPLTRSRALVVCEPAARPALRERLAEAERASLTDVTTNFAALTLAGSLAREVFARFSAIDLRPDRTSPGALRPGSIARQPGVLICEAPDRYLMMFGWATGEYLWSVVADAGQHLGGRPIGVDSLAVLEGPAPAREASRA